MSATTRDVLELVSFGVIAPAALFFLVSALLAPDPVTAGRTLPIGESTEQVVLELYVSSTCGAAKDTSFIRAIRSLWIAADNDSDGVNMRPTWKMAAVLDWDVNTGVTFLSRLGRFDEIAAGGNWLNSAVIANLSGSATSPSIPTLIVSVREVRVDSAAIRIVKSRTITRLEGVPAIVGWADARMLDSLRLRNRVAAARD